MPVTSFVVTGTALRAAHGRPSPLPSKTSFSDLHAGPRLRMRGRQMRGARPETDRAPLVWPFVQETKLPGPSCLLDRQPTTTVQRGRYDTPWRKHGLPPALPLQKAPGRFDRALFMLESSRSYRPPPCSSGDCPSSSACDATPPAGDRNKSFGKGEGSMRGEGEPFSKRVSLSPHQTFSSAILPA